MKNQLQQNMPVREIELPQAHIKSQDSQTKEVRARVLSSNSFLFGYDFIIDEGGP